jgi:hypothetical protein
MRCLQKFEASARRCWCEELQPKCYECFVCCVECSIMLFSLTLPDRLIRSLRYSLATCTRAEGHLIWKIRGDLSKW